MDSGKMQKGWWEEIKEDGVCMKATLFNSNWLSLYVCVQVCVSVLISSLRPTVYTVEMPPMGK